MIIWEHPSIACARIGLDDEHAFEMHLPIIPAYCCVVCIMEPSWSVYAGFLL